MSRSIGTNNPLLPIGELKLLPKHEKSYSKLSPDERKRIVKVVWDLNTCPLRDRDNFFVYDPNHFVSNVKRAVGHVLPKSTELPFTFEIMAVGDLDDLDTLTHEDRTILSSKGVVFRHCAKRLNYCGGPKPGCQVETNKETRTDFSVLIDRLNGDAVGCRAPGYILLISADFDFSESLIHLRQKGFRTLLAMDENSFSEFRDDVYFTWYWKDLRIGGRPAYQCKDFDDDELFTNEKELKI